MDKFWETAGAKLADRWMAVSAPALVFWLGGLLAWTHGHDGTHRITNWLDKQGPPAQVLTILIVLLGVAGSGIAVQQLVTPSLRLLEGYWPGWLEPLRAMRIRHVERKAKAEHAEWQELAPAVFASSAAPTREQLKRMTRVDERMRRRPRSAIHYMPTRIGNILRAAETWPLDKYGLDTVTVWPRLWLTLPDNTRKELEKSRTALDAAVSSSVWSVLFLAFSAWTPLAIPAALIVTTIILVHVLPSRAEVYADILEASFDLHRMALYQQLRWPLPTNPQEERGLGLLLTAYLRRGSDATEPVFTSPDQPRNDADGWTACGKGS
jgi:hypothetical protein